MRGNMVFTRQSLRSVWRSILLAILMLSFAFAVQAQQGQNAFPITAGTYEGSINDTTFSVRYSVTLVAGQTVTVGMETTSGDLDPFLLLFDPSETLLASNDDADQSNRNARIEFTAIADGDYLIEATRFDQAEGTGRGTYLLRVALSGAVIETPTTDPLTIPPQFGVDFSLLEYEQFATGTLDDATPKRYYALGGRQGDFVRLGMSITEGDIEPVLGILNSDLDIISRVANRTADEIIVYAALPKTGWYLVEATRNAGAGEFVLYPTRVADAEIQVGDIIEDTFSREKPVVSYLFDGRIGDKIFATARAENPNAQLELGIYTLSLEPLSVRAFEGNRAQIPAVTIPRSGPYILQLRNTNPGAGGTFTLNIPGVPVNIAKLEVEEARYNERYKGRLSPAVPVQYYRFAGKAGELVTVVMSSPTGVLDAYVILTDSSLTELTFNDNTGASRNARITQFALPADGDYYILATQPELLDGTMSGDYDLDIVGGQLRLNPGSLTVTLRWNGNADLNLFVRDPSGQTISWSNPTTPDDGTLQVDSNTQCVTPSTQPVEHAYFASPELAEGNYVIWVWYQADCGVPLPVNFGLTVTVAGEELLNLTPDDARLLQPGQRFEISVGVDNTGSDILGEGTISAPTAQQSASQGGDILIVYGQRDIIGRLTNDVYAIFYQFEGSAGDNIIITAERLTGTLDPIIVLRDDNDQTLADNDDASPNTSNAQLTYTLPTDGRYIIAVTRYGVRDGTSTGDFRLSLQKSGG
jgi:hypothetical protein